MKKILFLLVMTFTLFSFNRKNETFTGKIVYENTFTNSRHKDVTNRMAPFYGKQNNYFISGGNYKAYNENNDLLFLYNGSTNIYYNWELGKKTAVKFNAEMGATKKWEIKTRSEIDIICGYECASIEVKTEAGTTIYFFTPLIRVDETAFAKHNLGGWNLYLKATNGALPLKYIITDASGNVRTTIAREVTKLNLTQKDFDLAGDIR